MTVTEARKLLETPLVFGSPSQITARNILREVDDCLQAMLKCDADHFEAKRRSEKWRREIRFCECVDQWAPESAEDRGGDWSIVDAAIAAACNG